MFIIKPTIKKNVTAMDEFPRSQSKKGNMSSSVVFICDWRNLAASYFIVIEVASMPFLNGNQVFLSTEF